MADLSHLKVDLDEPQAEGRRGEAPRLAFSKYNALVDLLQNEGTGSAGGSGGHATSFEEITAGATETLLISKNVFDVTLTKANCLLILAPLPAYESSVMECTIILRQGTGSNVVTWPLTVKWPAGVAPVLSFDEGMADVVQLMSVDSGSSWFGSYIGGWYGDA